MFAVLREYRVEYTLKCVAYVKAFSKDDACEQVENMENERLADGIDELEIGEVDTVED